MKIDLVASLPHYVDHALPIFEELPGDVRGRVQPLEYPPPFPTPGRAALVASWQDVAQLSGRATMIYVEHGAGQGYAGDPASARMPGYSTSGGERHLGVVGFIAPSQAVADRWTTAPAVAVGCPKLDRYLREPRVIDRWSVCFAWHWDGHSVSQEASTAWHHYSVEMPEIVRRLQRQGFEVYGHAHPRWNGRLDEALSRCGFDAVLPTDADVLTRCGTLFVDNSSLGMEMMAVGGVTAWLNAPWYRRDVQHGGRFWNWTIGVPEINGPEDMIDLDAGTILNWGPEGREARDRLVASTYQYTDGSSSKRAAQWIVDLIGQR